MKNFLKLSIAILFFVAMQSCEDPTTVGQSVIPDDDALAVDSINFTDFVINAHRDDSLFTSFRATLQLGEYTTNQLGTSTATIYSDVFQIDTFEMANQATLDSAVFYLQTSSFQGDTTVAQSFDVYRLQNRIPPKDGRYRPYRIGEGFDVDDKIGSFENVVYSTDSTGVGEVTTNPYIKGYLDNSFTDDFFAKLIAEEIVTNDDVQDYFKSIAIQPRNTGNGKGFFNIDLQSSRTNPTGIAFHYHDENDSTYQYRIHLSPILDSSSSLFVFNHNQIKADYGTNEVAQQLNDRKDDGYDNGYVHGGNGVIAEIEFEELLNSIDASTLINVARLIIRPTVTNPADTLHFPERIAAYEEFNVASDGNNTASLIDVAGNGRTAPVNDRLFDNNSIATRQKDEDGYFYQFFLPNYFESVTNGRVEPKLLLGLPSSYHSSSPQSPPVPPQRSQSYKGFTFKNETGIELEIIYSNPNN